MLKTAQLPLRNRPRLRRDCIPQRIRAIVAADAILVGINLENVLGFVRIVLEGNQCVQETGAA